jgi:hypothetical protein
MAIRQHRSPLGRDLPASPGSFRAADAVLNAGGARIPSDISPASGVDHAGGRHHYIDWFGLLHGQQVIE